MLCCSSDLEPVTALVMSSLNNNVMNVNLEDVVVGCSGVRASRYVVEEGGDDDVEETLPLVLQEWRSKAIGDTSSLASTRIMNI